ncbi:MAG: type II methionyl aminopeptidase [Candidatus Aenigmarchaeota archaeon]|nr:type II methionyl aminopeptidase [Candidatus Aenigmarchaeota archaeon]
MDAKILEKYKKAGQIAAHVRAETEKKLKPGMKLLEIAEFIESSIRKKGGEPAFPVNLSLNEIAAHYTPVYKDETTVEAGDLLKIDIGVHVDGYIGDLAFTWCSEKNPLIKAAEKCLGIGIKVSKPGVTVSELGKAIEDASKEQGIGLIMNLTGHTLDKFKFHGDPIIPNKETGNTHAFKEGDIIALEPFTVESNGWVNESAPTEIYKHVMDRPVRLKEAREILLMGRDQFHSLPFAKRWLYDKYSPVKVAMSLRQLEAAYAVEGFPVLKEKDGKKIAQAEHTIIVGEKPLVTTELKD